MKKLLLSAFILIATIGCTKDDTPQEGSLTVTVPQFVVVNGDVTIDEVRLEVYDAETYSYSPDNHIYSTLATAPVIDGKFTITFPATIPQSFLREWGNPSIKVCLYTRLLGYKEGVHVGSFKLHHDIVSMPEFSVEVKYVYYDADYRFDNGEVVVDLKKGWNLWYVNPAALLETLSDEGPVWTLIARQ